MPQISLFKKISWTKFPETVDLLQYINDTKDGKWEDLVTQCRIIVNVEERDDFKQNMPTASLSGIFETRADSAIIQHSGILAIDLDEKIKNFVTKEYDVNIEDLNNLKELLKTDQFVYAVFLSTSGRGLRVLFRVVPNKHKESFLAISQYFRDHYKVIVDPNSSLSKPYCVSFDPDLFINEGATVWTKYNKETVLKKEVSFVHTPTDFKEVYDNVVQRGIWICPHYNDWVNLGFSLHAQFKEDGASYFHHLSKPDPKYNFDFTEKQYNYCAKHGGTGRNISTFYYLAKAAGVSITSEKTRIIIRTVKNGKKAGLSKETISKNLADHHGIKDAEEVLEKVYNDSSIQEDKDAEDSIFEQMEMFLASNYSLKHNLVTGYLEDNGKKVPDRGLHSIFVAMKKQIPKADFYNMKRLLTSDFVISYNPFFEFFGSDGIPVQCNEEKHNNEYESPIIDKFCGTIVNESGMYTTYFIKKWMVGVIASMHGDHSPLFLALLGGQGTGKTEWCRRWLPRQLMPYFVETKLNKGKDSEIELTENIIYFDDEMYGKSQKESQDFNRLSSQGEFSIRRPYGSSNEKIMNLSVGLGTSNYYEILKDPTGNRRVIPIDVLKIIHSLYNSINKTDLWMEAYLLYKQGFDWRIISNEDKTFLNQNKEKYEIVSFEGELIQRYYRVASMEEEKLPICTPMTATDIKLDLEKYTRANISVVTIGKELRRLLFTLRTVRDKETGATPKKWLVVKQEREENQVGGNMPF